MKKLNIEIPIYSQRLEVLLDCSFESMHKYVKDNHKGLKVTDLCRVLDYVPDPGAYGKGFMAQDADGQNTVFYLWIKSWGDDSWHIGFLAHETYHVVHELMDYAGVKLSKDCEEAFAYLNGFLVEKILSEMWKQPKRKAKQ